MFVAVYAAEEMSDFFRAQDDWELLWFFGKWDVFSKYPVLLQGTIGTPWRLNEALIPESGLRYYYVNPVGCGERLTIVPKLRP